MGKESLSTGTPSQASRARCDITERNENWLGLELPRSNVPSCAEKDRHIKHFTRNEMMIAIDSLKKGNQRTAREETKELTKKQKP